MGILQVQTFTSGVYDARRDIVSAQTITAHVTLDVNGNTRVYACTTSGKRLRRGLNAGEDRYTARANVAMELAALMDWRGFNWVCGTLPGKRQALVFTPIGFGEG